MTQAANLLGDLPAALPQEIVQTLVSGSSVRIERIISRGHASPESFWYDQVEHEWVLVVSGRARVRLEGEEAIELSAGSFLNIPARRRHRVDWTDPDQPTVWLAIHYQT